MSTETVAAPNTGAIHLARDNAGPYGRVIFPYGTPGAGGFCYYDINQLYANVAHQTWVIEPGVVLLRNSAAPPSAVIEQIAGGSGLKVIGGILDGNRGVNNQPGNGIYSAISGNDLEMDGTVIQNIVSWGATMQDSLLRMRHVTIKATGFACLLWSDTTGPGIQGPDIDDCEFDRTMEGPTPNNGLVLIGSSRSGQFIFNPRFTNNRCRMQNPGSSISNLIEVKHSIDLRCSDNLMIGGHTAISVGFSKHDMIARNICRYAAAYGIEYSGDEGTIAENIIDGGGVHTQVGIIGNGCTASKAIGNSTFDCLSRFQVVAGGVLADLNNT